MPEPDVPHHGMKRIDPTARLTARELEPDLYEVTVSDTWGPMNLGLACNRIVPHFRNGRAYGFKLFGVREPYTQLGLRSGDIVLRVNGVALSSPKNALEVYAKTVGSRAVEVDLERDGLLLTKTYVLGRPLGEAR